MINDDIKIAAISAIHDHYNCNGKYPCSERSYCKFCSGYNSAFDCGECGADDFNEGFLVGARWRIDTVWHDMNIMPNFKCLQILMEHKSGSVHFMDNLIYTWEELKKYYVRWAYIADLLPDRKEAKQ